MVFVSFLVYFRATDPIELVTSLSVLHLIPENVVLCRFSLNFFIFEISNSHFGLIIKHMSIKLVQWVHPPPQS